MQKCANELSWLDNKIISHPEVARRIGMNRNVFYNKYHRLNRAKFTTKDLEKLTVVWEEFLKSIENNK